MNDKSTMLLLTEHTQYCTACTTLKVRFEKPHSKALYTSAARFKPYISNTRKKIRKKNEFNDVERLNFITRVN